MTKTGRFAKFLPPRYHEGFFASLEDAEATSLKHELALLDARQEELLRSLGEEAASGAWRDVRDAKDGLLDVFRLLREKRPVEASQLLQSTMEKLQKATDAIEQNEKAWQQLQEVMEQKRKIVEAEIKREAKLSETVTAEQLAWLMSQITLIFREFITDKRMLNEASLKLRTLMRGNVHHEPNAPPNVPALLAGDDDYGAVEPDGP